MPAELYMCVLNSLNVLGIDNENELIRHVFFYTGRLFSLGEILHIYAKAYCIAAAVGYSNPLEYMRDCFSDGCVQQVRVYNRPAHEKEVLEYFEDNVSYTQTASTDRMYGADSSKGDRLSSISLKECSRTATKEEAEGRSFESKNKSTKVGSPARGSNVQMSANEKHRITKDKKMHQYYRSMDQQEKDFDNIYDHFSGKSRVNEGGKFFFDSRNALADNPIFLDFLDAFEIQLREIVLKICGNSVSKDKDKNRWAKEIEVFEEYYSKKFNYKNDGEYGIKKLTSEIVKLLHIIQLKLFEIEDPGVQRAILHFKNKLHQFYNFYRK
ncbi:hypothetical protein ENBRE01_0358 [Enteropsectra breve]|nr:hypothetical protein ENBRE01_0358 [Enteropsectra breve]